MTSHLNKAAEFYESVEKMARGGATYLDAIVEWCSRKGLEIESVAPLIEKNPKFLAQLRIDAEDLHFLSKGSRLPL
jgi:hypothetical protein